MSRLVVAAVALAIGASASGCSFALVRRAPPEPEPLHWPKCTEHRMFPAADAVYGLLFVALTASLLHDNDEFSGLGLIFSVPAAIGFGSGAIYGLHETSRCKDAREAYERAAEQGR